MMNPFRASHLGHALVQAILVAALVFLGYAFSVVIILLSLMSIMNIVPTRNGVDASLLHTRYRFDGFSGYFDTIHYSITASIGFVLVLSVGCSLAWRSLPIFFLPIRACIGPGLGRQRAGRMWRTALWRKRPIHPWACFAFFGIGFGGAWFSVLIDPWVAYVNNEIAVRNGIYDKITMPVPVVGWFTWSDGLPIVLGVSLLLMALIVLPARRDIMRLKGVCRRWCSRCYYPIIEKRAHTNGDFRCPECGAKKGSAS